MSAAGQEVTATFRVVAVANGTVGTLWLTFDADGLPGGAAISNIYVTSQNRISGDDKDGTYQIRFTVPAGMPPGPLRPGIETYYYNSELDFSSGEFHGWAGENDYNPAFPWPAAVQQALQVVNTGTVDTQAPVLTRISLPANEMISKGNGEWALTGTMAITDNLDASPNISVFLTDSTGDDRNGYSSFIRNPDNSLSVTLTAYEDNDDCEEIFYLGVEVTDAVGNQRLYISSQADFPGPFKGPVIFPQTGPSGYASWRAGVFEAAAAADPGISGEAADPDRDGVSNLMEYALGLVPTAPDAAGVPELVREGANTYFRYTRSLDRPDLSFLVQTAATPAGPWSPAGLTPVSTVSQGTRETVTFAVPAAGRGFLRLQVNK